MASTAPDVVKMSGSLWPSAASMVCCRPAGVMTGSELSCAFSVKSGVLLLVLLTSCGGSTYHFVIFSPRLSPAANDSTRSRTLFSAWIMFQGFPTNSFCITFGSIYNLPDTNYEFERLMIASSIYYTYISTYINTRAHMRLIHCTCRCCSLTQVRRPKFPTRD